MIKNLIDKKKLHKELSMEDYYLIVEYMLKNGVDNSIVELFQALDSFGMSKAEVYYLALAMRDSGRVLTFNQAVFEKHSTGGVGDSTSIVLIPLIASLGYKIIKTTAKSLVFTNGSADRFGAIPNFNVKLTDNEIKRVLDNTNACVLSHNGDICPADRLLYQIMEKCNLSSNPNLLASSIACKKLASGAKMVLVDVKFGYAAVLREYKQAKKAARLLKYVFNRCGVKSVIVITNTLQTIGEGIGNAIEVEDGLSVLRGKRCLLRRVVVRYAIEMISAINKKYSKKDLQEMVESALDNGNAYRQFLSLVKNQGGSVEAVTKQQVFRPYHAVDFLCTKSGYVGNINSVMLGEMVRNLCKESHDNHIGVRLRVKIGDLVRVGDKVLTFYYKSKQDLKAYQHALCYCVNLTDVKIRKVNPIKKVIR